MFRLNKLFKSEKSAGARIVAADLEPEIRRSFNDAARDEEHFPSTIDPRIYHVKLLADFLGEIDSRRVLDAGCGKGRFARILKERHPAATICCMDIAEAMLRITTDEPLRTRLAEAGPPRAAQFSWQQTAEATLAALLSAGRGV